jgi:hypothetical protein
MVTMIIAARLAPLPTMKDGVVAEVTPHLKPELTALSKSTPVDVTVSDTVVLLVRPPPVPVMVNVEEPTGVLAPVVIVSVEVVVAGFGLNVPAAPEGNPLIVRLTGLVKPPDGVIVTLYVVEPPCCTVWLDGVALSAKFGAFTTRETVLLCVKAPLVPVSVSV